MVRHHIEAGAKLRNELVLVCCDIMIVLNFSRYSVRLTSYRVALQGETYIVLSVYDN